jgi:hypothetical protein
MLPEEELKDEVGKMHQRFHTFNTGSVAQQRASN